MLSLIAGGGEVEEKYIEQIDQLKWEQLIAAKEKIFKYLEDARADKKIIGDSLEADIYLELPDEPYQLLANNLELFKETMGVADIHITQSEEEKVEVKKIVGSKCPRCWNWFNEIQADLCPRCQDVIREM